MVQRFFPLSCAIALLQGIFLLSPAQAGAPVITLLCKAGQSCALEREPASQVLAVQGQTPGDGLGAAISLDGDWLAVGAPYDTQAGQKAGAVYLFRRGNDGVWQQMARLAAARPKAGALFGSSVALRGNRLLVGAPGEKQGDTDVNAGAAYVFVRTGNGRWKPQATLSADKPKAGDYFGASVVWAGKDAVIAAHLHDGEQIDSGAVDIFRDGKKGWNRIQQLEGAGKKSGTIFGNTLAADDRTLVVGAYGDDSNTPGGGAVFVHERQDDGTFVQKAILHASNKKAFSEFGWSLALHGDTLLVGAPYEDEGPLVNGAAYLFQRRDGQWNPVTRLSAAEMDIRGRFGASVALSDKGMASGIPYGQGIVWTQAGDDWQPVFTVRTSVPEGQNLYNRTIAMDGDTLVFGIPGSRKADNGRVVVLAP